MTLANKFTLSRIILAPLFFIIYFAPSWFGFPSFVSVCILIPLLVYTEFTDFLDGHFARKMKEVSDFGKIFDPFADILLHMVFSFLGAVKLPILQSLLQKTTFRL